MTDRDPDPLTMHEAMARLRAAWWTLVADLAEALPVPSAWTEDAVDAAWCAAAEAECEAVRAREEFLYARLPGNERPGR